MSGTRGELFQSIDSFSLVVVLTEEELLVEEASEELFLYSFEEEDVPGSETLCNFERVSSARFSFVPS